MNLFQPYSVQPEPQCALEGVLGRQGQGVPS